MPDRKPVLGPEFRPPAEGIQRPLSREPRSKWRGRRPVELIVGPFYRAADFARRPTKRQALLSLLALVVTGFLLTATWSLAGRLDPGHDPQWSHQASGAVGPVALSPNGRVLVAAVAAADGSELQAFRAGGRGDPFVRVAFHGVVSRAFVSDDGARALVAVEAREEDPSRVGPAADERGGPGLYLVELRTGAILVSDSKPVVRAMDASGDLSRVVLAHPNSNAARVFEEGVSRDGVRVYALRFEHEFQEQPTAVAISRDGRVAAFGSFGGAYAVRALAGATTHEGSLAGHESTSLALAADGSRVLAGFGAQADRGGRLLFFDDLRPGLPPRGNVATALPVEEVALDGEGSRGLARTSGGEPQLLGLAEAGEEAWNVTLRHPAAAARLSADGSTVAVAYAFHGVEARRAASGALRWAFDQDRNESRIETTALGLSEDGSVVVANGRKGGDAEPVRLLVFDRDREGGLLGPLWSKVLVAGVLEGAAVVGALWLWERRRAKKAARKSFTAR